MEGYAQLCISACAGNALLLGQNRRRDDPDGSRPGLHRGPGSGLFKLGKLSCDFPGGPLQDVAGTQAFLVSGSQHASGFTVVLSLKGRPAGIVYAGLDALLNDGLCGGLASGPPIPVPFTGPSRAAGSSNLRVLMHGGCGGSVNDVLTADTTVALSGSGS